MRVSPQRGLVGGWGLVPRAGARGICGCRPKGGWSVGGAWSPGLVPGAYAGVGPTALYGNDNGNGDVAGGMALEVVRQFMLTPPVRRC